MDLNHYVIHLSLEPDSLVWSLNKESRQVTAKLSYNVIVLAFLHNQKKWWFYSFWKWCVPLKFKLLCWLMLKKKILKWHNFVKRGGTSPRICVLCIL